MEFFDASNFVLHQIFGQTTSGLDFQKKILGPAGLQVFIFGRQDKYSSCQKLFIFKKK